MITLIIKSYLITMLAILAGSIVLFITGLTFIFRLNRKNKKETVKVLKKESPEKTLPNKLLTITSQDISAISGDDMMATQLDLARAYIETGKVRLAKKILNHVLEKGTVAQQQEAHSLLGLI